MGAWRAAGLMSRCLVLFAFCWASVGGRCESSVEDAPRRGVMPAYNAARTLVRTYRDIPPGVVDHVILVDEVPTDNLGDAFQRYRSLFERS
jgi:hypothetical protein